MRKRCNSHWWQQGLLALAAVLSLAPVAGMAASGGAPASGAAAQFKNNAYIVQMADMPVTAYQGGVAGLAATKPAKGQKINPNAPDVAKYMAYLSSRHDAAMRGVGATRKLYSYGYVYNGFAADMTPAQAQRLAQMPGVLAVNKDELRTRDTASTPAFLGLSGAGGFWNTTGATGEGVIIGIIDSGIWPEHPSVSDRVGSNGNASKDGKLGYQQIPGWHGRCVPGEAFRGTECNQKLIGARYYNEGRGGNAGVDKTMPWEFNSPRDYGGHGTHTATTAGGNANVATTGDAAVFGSVSGIAPRARIAAYKVCWENGSTGGTCATSDSVAAIDQAVADGVDVINFSISGSSTNFRDAVEIAFLFAADAGVFVAASAGNSGPTASTVAHPGPWLTTVAAGTHNRDGIGSVTLGNGVTYAGASVATPVGPKPLIGAEVAGLPGADPARVRLCYAAEDNDGKAVLDPAKIAGKIVVCDRGVTGRVNKSLAVKEGGGVGMLLLNPTANSLNADFHSVPTVHLQNTDRAPVKAYAATAGATATINGASTVLNAAAPFTASFSSRGPLLAGAGDLLKPDIIAPGQDILAGVAPPGNGGKLFDLYSGTSMSSPHIAGIAALFKQVYPSWSPMAIKSALMTTAGDVLDGPNTNPLVIFRQGAGHVQSSKALNPGLVFDSGYNDWLNFICGVQPGGFCSAFTPIDPSNFNVASIAVGELIGSQTVKRRVTNVGGNPATYTATVAGMAGLTVSMSPPALTLAAGQTKEFTLTFAHGAAAFNTYTGGQLTLTNGTHNVRVPMVVRPVGLVAPAQVGGSYSVTFGYDGPFTATPRGLVASTTTAGTVADDTTDGPCSLTSPNAVLVPVVVPAGTSYVRFATFDADVNAGSDLDLCVFRGSTEVGSSGSATSAEEVSLHDPTAATYTVVVQGWGVVGSTPFKLHTWLLGTADAGNMAVTAPAAATLGSSGAITLGFSGLTVGRKYLGSVAYGGVADLPNPTIVRVDP